VEALEFFEGLEADNSKAYWQANKATYETTVLAPMEALLAELEPDYGEGRVFRPYRDVRFSKDKSPYKTAIGAVLGDGYIQLSAKGLAAGNGMYSMAPDQLERYRQAVASDVTGPDLAAVIGGVEQHKITVHGHEVLKTAPRGYPADHPRIELLRYKGVVAWREWPVEPWLATAGAKERITGFLVATRPLAAWLAAHVGASTAGPARR
jgi:uncharacterized protein (TIGR02453 family)